MPVLIVVHSAAGRKSACIAFPGRLCVHPEHREMNDQDVLPLARPVEPSRGGRLRVPRTGLMTRLGLLAVATVLAGVFAVAFWINPYEPDGTPRRMATHTQLGIPPCHFVLATGKPCPACGMTTSFALLVRGDVGASLRANWAGTLIALLWGATLVWAVAGGIKGRALFIPSGRGEMILTLTVGVVLAVMLLRWAIVLLSG